MYIKGMLDNPGMGPNATVNRWIEEILMFHFELKHVRGLTFSADGLSRRKKQPGDENHPSPEDGFDENPPPEKHAEWDDSISQPYDFEDFKHGIDTRGGYFNEIHEEPEKETLEMYGQFANECWNKYSDEQSEAEMIRNAFRERKLEIPQYIMSQIREEEPMLPHESFKFDPEKREPYPETQRTKSALRQDVKLGMVRE
jgi:hypothetical protein